MTTRRAFLGLLAAVPAAVARPEDPIKKPSFVGVRIGPDKMYLQRFTEAEKLEMEGTAK